MNLTEKISKYFTLGEATYLPKWNTNHIPTEEELTNLRRLAAVLDAVRDYIGSPIIVHVWIRPEAANCVNSDHNGQSYNKLVGGASRSLHRYGLACDFHFKEIGCDDAKILLMPKLEDFGLRMEDNGAGAGWIHLDLGKPNPNRFFKP